jgi:hypothetical protein
VVTGYLLGNPSSTRIWGGELPDENAFASIKEANATLSLIMRHWNSIASELEIEGLHLPLVFEVETGAVPGRKWARGFMRGVQLARSAWNELFGSNEKGQLITIPLVAGEIDPKWPRETITAEKGTELLGWMGRGWHEAIGILPARGARIGETLEHSPTRCDGQHRRSAATSHARVVAGRNSSAVVGTPRRPRINLR